MMIMIIIIIIIVNIVIVVINSTIPAAVRQPPRRAERLNGYLAYGYLVLQGKIRPVHLLRGFLLRVLESNFPGDPL